MTLFPNGSVLLDGKKHPEEMGTIDYLIKNVKCGHFLQRKTKLPVRGKNVEDSSDEEVSLLNKSASNLTSTSRIIESDTTVQECFETIAENASVNSHVVKTQVFIHMLKIQVL